MSVISRIELLGFVFNKLEDEVKAKKFLEDSTMFQLTDAIADQAIEIRKLHKIKLGDAIIAATSLVNDLTLLTRNEADFENIFNLKFINPFKV